MAPTRTPRPSRIRRSSRWTLVVAIVFALSSASGCMVMDELDTAAAKMPTTARDKQKQSAPSGKPAAAADRLAAAKGAVLERSKQWWKEAKTMTPGEKPAGVVSCRLSEGTRFMSRDDCIVQGGRPADHSS